MYFVDFLREPIVDDETGETIDAHPSNYESVPGGLKDIRARVEALQKRFNEESKVRTSTHTYSMLLNRLVQVQEIAQRV